MRNHPKDSVLRSAWTVWPSGGETAYPRLPVSLRFRGYSRKTARCEPNQVHTWRRLVSRTGTRGTQDIGCEGYVENPAVGRRGETIAPPPPTTAHDALLAHITGGHIETIDAGASSFQPMNINFGLFPPIAEPVAYDKDGRKYSRGSAKNVARKGALSARALADLEAWMNGARADAAQ